MCEKSDHTLLYAAGVERSILERGLVEEELDEEEMEEKVEEENVAKVDEEVDEEMRKVTTPCMPVVGIDRYWRGAGAQEGRGEGGGGIGTLKHSQFVSKCSSGNEFCCLSLGNKPRKHKINYTWGGCWLLGRGRWQGWNPPCFLSKDPSLSALGLVSNFCFLSKYYPSRSLVSFQF